MMRMVLPKWQEVCGRELEICGSHSFWIWCCITSRKLRILS